MLDIKFIRENAELVQRKSQEKRVDVNVQHILEIDEAYRKALQSVQKLQEERNKVAKERNIEEGKRIKEKLEKEEHALSALKQELDDWLMKVPNMPLADVPVGKDEEENVEVRKWGNPREFTFPVKDHVELGKLLDIIDIDTAANVTGARFNYLKNEAVLLEMALIQFTFSVLTNRDILQKIAHDIADWYSPEPFVPVLPPMMIRPDVYTRMGRLSPEQEVERYHLERDDLYLVGSAEHTLGPMHMDQQIPEDQLPLRYIGFSSAFRREAGSYGKDTKGILRVHQFDKLEMESFTLPQHSQMEQDFIVAIQEYLMQQLEIPYRVVLICTGDMGSPDARQLDIAAWVPSQHKYRETHTSDLMTDYQARRLGTKVRKSDGSTEYVHMNDATAFAIGRTLVAIIENNQQEDGSVTIPKVLQPFIGKAKILPKNI